MSSYDQLKQKRQGKRGKSYVATTDLQPDVPLDQESAVVEPCEVPPKVEVKPGSVGQIPYNPEFPATLPQDLEIRIHSAHDIEKGRGIYSRGGRKPGEYLPCNIIQHFNKCR